MTPNGPTQNRNGRGGKGRLLDRALGIAGSQRLSILIYHRVLAEADYMRPGDPTVAQFNWQMELIARHFVPLSLSEALRLMAEQRLPDRAVCVTFDDGYADNLRLALPVLSKFGLSATVFVSTAFIDGGRMWNDTVVEAIRATRCQLLDLSSHNLGVHALDSAAARRTAAHTILNKIKHLPPEEREQRVAAVAKYASDMPSDLMLTTLQLRDLHRSGIKVGAHTHTHPILAMLNPDLARDEILHSKVILENILDDRVRFFAYPNGKPAMDYTSVHRDMVQSMGFEAAFTTQQGVSGSLTDRWQLPRFTPWDNSPWRFSLRLILNQRRLI